MKRTLIRKFLLLPLLFLAGSIIAQPPPSIPIQAVAKDALGNPAKNRRVYVKDIIFQTNPTGTKVWEEAHVVTSDNDGIYTINVGSSVNLSASGLTSIGKIDWGNGPFFINLKVAIAPSIPASWWVAADNYIDFGTTQMLSVPYALFAGNASVTNVNTSIPAGPRNTFLITDSLGNVNWAVPQAAQQSVTTVTNFNLNLSIQAGQNINIQPNTTAVVAVTVLGVRAGDPILVTPQGEYINWSVYSAWASADNTVKIRFANFTDRPVDVLGSEYKIIVIK